MSDTEKSGWISPPGKPSPMHNADAKTSRAAVALGAAIIAAVIGLSWWIKHK